MGSERVWKSLGVDEGAGESLLSCVCLCGRRLQVASLLGGPCLLGGGSWAGGRGRGTGTYREDVGTPLGLLADGCGGGGGSDGLDAQLPLADAGGGGD